MSAPRFVSYRRVSTKDQGRSGLGLEAQSAAIAQLVTASGGRLVEDFEEVETGKGSDALERRPVLAQALRAAKARKATLIVSRLDRLSRNLHFVSGLLEHAVDIKVADMPQADKRMLQVFAMVGEWERDAIASRIAGALRAKKEPGESVGNLANLHPHNVVRSQLAADFAGRMKPTLEGFSREGLTQRQMVQRLNAIGSSTAQGGQWSLMQLQRVLARIKASRPLPRCLQDGRSGFPAA